MDGHNFARLIITRIDDVNDESKKRKLCIFIVLYNVSQSKEYSFCCLFLCYLFISILLWSGVGVEWGLLFIPPNTS